MKSFIGRLVIVALLIVFVLIAVQGVLYWQVRHQLQTRIRKLQQRSMPVSIAELGGPTTSQSQVVAELEELEQALESLEKIVSAIPANQDGKGDIVAQNAAFREFVPRHPDLVARLRNASRLPVGSCCDFTLHPSLFLASVSKQSVGFRRAARALAYDAELELAEGSTDQAARDAVAILRWGEHASHEPALINFLVSVAIDSVGISIASRCIAKGDLSNQIRTELINDVAKLDSSGAWSRGLVSERALGISLYQQNMGAARHLKSMVADQSRYLDLIEEFLQAGRDPFGILSLQPAPGASLSALVEPALKAAMGSLRRLQTQQHAVLILVAWKDSEQRPNGSIDELPVGSATLVDPFDGSKMKMQIATPRVTIYSVGSNLADDGGTLADELDVGIEVSMDRREGDSPDGGE